MRSATARAYPNIALIKYWGKRDEEYNLPATGSLSLTLDHFKTDTTVTLTPAEQTDRFELNGELQGGESLRRVAHFLGLVRTLAGSDVPAAVTSSSDVPTGAGLASSAAGFAALAVAAAAAYDLTLTRDELSALARRGSGSAARSLIDGVSVWHRGSGHETSFAEPVEAPEMRLVTVTVDSARKPVSSREAMRRTRTTSPYFPAWVELTSRSLEEMLEACRTGDFRRIGELTEEHALRMHACINGCRPPIRYLTARSYAVFDRVLELRSAGTLAYATADAGPNVVVLTRPGDAEAVAGALADLGSVRVTGPGPGAVLWADR